MSAITQQELDRFVEEQLSLVLRFAGAVSHDVANVILPPRDDAAPRGQRAMVEHIMSMRRALDLFRRGLDDPPLSCTVEQWWFFHCRMLSRLCESCPVLRLRCDEATDAATIDPALLSRLMAMVLIAIDAHDVAMTRADVMIEAGNGRLRLAMRSDPPELLDNIRMPTRLQETVESRCGRVESGDDGSAVCFDLPIERS